MSVPSPASLDDHVAGRVDHIGVVAGAAGHRVVAGAAVEVLLPALPVSVLSSGVAGAVDRRPVPVSVRFSTLAPSV